MAYIIKKQDLADDKDFTSTFTHDETGITVTFYSAVKPAFLRTHALIMAKREQEQDTPLTAEVIANISDDELNINEAMGYAIGEHLIADWDVMMDDDGRQEKLPITGENFVKLLSNLPNGFEFSIWCLECSEKTAQSAKQKATDLAKKPSKGSNGSKTTKT
ncbi:hypothetical protein MHK07_10050 [Moraxella nonliquefaciens]|uniref:hypothetical protein n=1 Tax=Moraxella nonliquefaciens TaxID=478 RepID=UPI001EF7100D|nr:hypothetical protein [Moraxella nonliquefaciens]MCG7412834.1 hypothetical protein [Moraxella nonliquefaciens]